MRKYLTKALLVLWCVMLCGTISNATTTDKAENNTTINAPFVTISDISLNKQTVRKNQKLQYQFTLSFVDDFDYYNEDLNGGAFMDDSVSKDSNYYVVVHWQSPKKQKIVRVYKWPETKKTIMIKDTIPVKKGMQAGEWGISDIYIENYYSLEGDDEGTSLVILDGTEDEQAKKGDIDTYYTDLSAFDFTVTGVKKKADNVAPTISKKSIKVSKKKVKANKTFTFYVKVKDASGVESVSCTWDVNTKYGKFSQDYKMKYNKKKKCYQCKIELHDTDYKAKLRCIATKDIYGNKEYYDLSSSKMKKKYKKAFSNVTVYRK